MRKSRLILCGPGRVGKTSFCRSLLGLPFSPVLDSTIGVELTKVSCTVVKHEEKWVWKVDDTDDQQIKLTIAAALQNGEICTKVLHGNVTAAPKAAHADRRPGTADPRAADSEAGDKQADTPQLVEEIVGADAFQQLAGRDIMLLDIVDFGGQHVFALVQHIVASGQRCGTAVVFDASLSMDALVDATFGDYQGEHAVCNAPKKKNIECIEDWLLVTWQTTGGEGPLYLVGSKADLITARKQKEVEHFLWRFLDGKPYQVDDIFFVNNKRSGSWFGHDKQVITFRQKFLNDMAGSVSMATLIPLRWLPFAFSLQSLTCQEKPVLSISEATALATDVCVSPSREDAMQVLRFHHDLGHMLHFPENPELSRHVVVDIDWLLQLISALLIPRHEVKQQNKRFRTHYALLYNDGVLLESLADHLWEQHCPAHWKKLKAEPGRRQYLFQLLEQFAILVHAKQLPVSIAGMEKGSTYVMPSVVTSQTDVMVPHEGGHSMVVYSPPLILYVGQQCIFPLALFWRLAVSLMLYARDSGAPPLKPALHQNSVRLLMRSCFWLEAQHFTSGVVLTMQYDSSAFAAGSRVPTPSEQMEDVCPAMLGVVERCLRDLCSDCFEQLTWTRACVCWCPLSEAACIKHNNTGCMKVACQHFVELEAGKVLHCPRGDRIRENVAGTMATWLPELEVR